MGESKRRFRTRQAVGYWLVAIFTGVLTGTAWLTDLSLVEKVLGCVFFGGTCVYSLITAVRRSRGASAATAQWAFRSYAGPYADRKVQGVACPLAVQQRGVLPFAVTSIGLALLCGAAYILITGEGVEGGAATSVVAIILCALFGAIMMLGGIGMRGRPNVAASAIVLAPEALHLPILTRAEPLPWEDVASVDHGTTGPVPSSSPGRRVLSGEEYVDFHGHDGGRLVRVKLTGVPTADRIATALQAVHRDPALRAALASPDAPARLTPESR